MTNVRDCPAGSQGEAYKFCDKEIGWFPADFFNCTSQPFVELKETVCDAHIIKPELFYRLIDLQIASWLKFEDYVS